MTKRGKTGCQKKGQKRITAKGVRKEEDPEGYRQRRDEGSFQKKMVKKHATDEREGPRS